MYLAGDDALIYAAVKNYFSAARDQLWLKAKGGSYIVKTIGIQALFDILRALSGEAIERKDVSKEFFAQRLSTASGIDFSNDFFTASGIGRTRIRNCLELRLGLRGLEEVNQNDLATYRQVCQM